jgi:hypothetical protein
LAGNIAPKREREREKKRREKREKKKSLRKCARLLFLFPFLFILLSFLEINSNSNIFCNDVNENGETREVGMSILERSFSPPLLSKQRRKKSSSYQTKE